MKVRDIFTLNESIYVDTMRAVRDQLAVFLASGRDDMPTAEFRKVLADNGFVLSPNDVDLYIERSGFDVSVNDGTVSKGSEPEFDDDFEPAADMDDVGDIDDIGAEIDDEMEDETVTDVSGMAGNQALDDIKSDL